MMIYLGKQTIESISRRGLIEPWAYHNKVSSSRSFFNSYAYRSLWSFLWATIVRGKLAMKLFKLKWEIKKKDDTNMKRYFNEEQ